MDFTQREQKADLSFGILSDLHMTHRGEGLQKLSQYMALFAKITPAIDAHVFTGDIVYQIDLSGGGSCPMVYHEPYDYLNAAIARYAPKTPVLYANGNHEFPQHNTDPAISEEARRVMQKKIGKPLHYHKVIGGYHFILVDLASYACTFGEKTEKWAMKEIKKALAASKTNPVFVVYHTPIQHTVEGSSGKHHSDEFASFLLSDSRIINLCGHLHDPVQSPTAIWQKENGGTVFHAPMSAVGYVSVRRSRARNLPRIDQSQAAYCEVFGSRVVIHKIDVLEGKEIGEPWVIDTQGEQYYTDARKEKAATPVFPEDAKAEAKEAEGGVAFTFPKAKCEPMPFNDDAEVPYYRFTFFAKGEKEPIDSFLWHSDFYKAAPAAVFADVVRVSLPVGEYRVKIQPVSYFGKEGDAITANVKIKNPTEAPYSRMEDPDLFPML